MGGGGTGGTNQDKKDNSKWRGHNQSASPGAHPDTGKETHRSLVRPGAEGGVGGGGTGGTNQDKKDKSKREHKSVKHKSDKRAPSEVESESGSVKKPKHAQASAGVAPMEAAKAGEAYR